MINKVYFVSEEEACQMTGNNKAGIISITCSHNADLKSGWKSILRLKFDDIDSEMTSKESGCYKLFSDLDANKIFSWLAHWQYDLDVVVVHCAAGISRSAAVAKFIADIYGLKFNHSYTLYNKHIYKTLRNHFYGKPF